MNIRSYIAPSLSTFIAILDELYIVRGRLNFDLRGGSRGAFNQEVYRASQRLQPLRDCVARMLQHEDTLMADRMWLRLIAELGAQIEFQCFEAIGATTKDLAMRCAFRGYGAADHAIDHAQHLVEQAREVKAA